MTRPQIEEVEDAPRGWECAPGLRHFAKVSVAGSNQITRSRGSGSAESIGCYVCSGEARLSSPHDGTERLVVRSIESELMAQRHDLTVDEVDF